MRIQATVAALMPLQAPDGTQAQVVENNPKKVVFFVSDGPHKGYYHYDKQRKTYAIVAA